MKYFLSILCALTFLTGCSRRVDNIVDAFNILEEADITVFLSNKLFKVQDKEQISDILISASFANKVMLVSFSRNLTPDKVDLIKDALGEFRAYGFVRVDQIDEKNILFSQQTLKSAPKIVNASTKIDSIRPSDLVTFHERQQGGGNQDLKIVRKFTCKPGDVDDSLFRVDISILDLKPIASTTDANAELREIAQMLNSINMSSFEAAVSIDSNSEGEPFVSVSLPSELASFGKMYLAFANVRVRKEGDLEEFDLPGQPVWGKELGDLYVVTSSKTDMPKSVNIPLKNALTITLSPQKLAQSFDKIPFSKYLSFNKRLLRERLDFLNFKSIQIVAPISAASQSGIDTSKVECRIEI